MLVIHKKFFLFAIDAAFDAPGAAKILNLKIITKKFLFLFINFKEIKIKTIKLSHTIR